MKDNFKNPTQAFEYFFDEILKKGEYCQNTYALYNVSFTVQNPQEKNITTPWRKFNSNYANAEYNWYLSGDRDASQIAKRAPMWKNMMIDGTTEVNSNYGSYWSYDNQLRRVINEIKANKETRRAVVVHFDLNNLDTHKYDTPCNIGLHFQFFNGKLNLSVFARSIDLWYGYGNDQYCFTRLLEDVANEISMQIGNIHWFISNLHLYTNQITKREEYYENLSSL